MSEIRVYKKDESKLILESDDDGALMEVSEHFSFMVPGFKFVPSYRNKLWDGRLRIFNRQTSILPYGLLAHLGKFAKARGYTLNIEPGILQTKIPDIDELSDYVIKELKITSRGEPIVPRDYQIDGFSHAVREGRSLLISPTGSGKSLIIYMLLRWFLEVFKDEKVLIVVPTVSLVHQMQKDFIDYSTTDDGFNGETETHMIYSGKEKINFQSRVVVTTWQSAINMTRAWFLQFGMIIGDEAHGFKSKSLTTIMDNLGNARYRIGTTGTLDDTLVNELVLTGCFGPVYRVTSSRDLIEAGTLADLKIKCLVIKYDDETKKQCTTMDYKQEIDFLVTNTKRNQFIKNLAIAQTGNTLVLYRLVQKHGKPLHKSIQAAVVKGRKVFFVSGEVSAEEREAIREITETQTNAIIIASIATFATGINIKNLHSLILAAPAKGQITLLQSIGRVLRKSDNGKGSTVYDIADDLSWKKHKNFTLKHAIERIKIYAKERFKYKLIEVPFTK